MDSLNNLKITSKMASSGKSVQWTAFLILSIPNKPLNDFGLNALAISYKHNPKFNI